MKRKLRYAIGYDAGYRDGGDRDDRAEAEQLPFDAETVHEIGRLLEKVTEGDSEERLITLLNDLLADRAELEAAAVAWVDLIEVLVQSAEPRYKERGRGGLKKEEVKGVVLYLLRTGRFELPQVPDYLQPVIVDAIADFTVDAIVKLANENGLWVVSGSPRVTAPELWHRLKRGMLVLLTPLARVASWIYLRARFPARVSPALRTALANLERDGMIGSGPTMLERKFEVVLWIGRNRDALVAGVQLVGLVAEEVEQFLELGGEEKKVAARELVLAVLEELGWVPQSAILEGKLVAVIDAAIDGVVHLFNKRGKFVHRRPAAAALRRAS